MLQAVGLRRRGLVMKASEMTVEGEAETVLPLPESLGSVVNPQA